MTNATEQVHAIGKDGSMGSWKITILPKGGTQQETRIVVATGLLPIVQKYPDTMTAEFLGQGECLIDCPEVTE